MQIIKRKIKIYQASLRQLTEIRRQKEKKTVPLAPYLVIAVGRRITALWTGGPDRPDHRRNAPLQLTHQHRLPYNTNNRPSTDHIPRQPIKPAPFCKQEARDKWEAFKKLFLLKNFKAIKQVETLK